MKIKIQYETETYVSNSGYLCIRQEVGGEDSLVMLSPLQCKLLATELRTMAKQPTWWSETIADDKADQ
jgi:hypothetical protein